MADISHIGQLKPDSHNARQHNPRNVGMIADALQQVGAARSIVVDENLVVLAGNGVLEAAAQAGIEKVQVIDADGETIIAVRRSGLTDEQKKKLALFDNRTAELATWDPSQIAADLEAGLDLSGMFYPEELSAILEQAGDMLIVDDGEFANSHNDRGSAPTKTGIVVGFGRFAGIVDAQLVDKAADAIKVRYGEDASNALTELCRGIVEGSPDKG